MTLVHSENIAEMEPSTAKHWALGDAWCFSYHRWVRREMARGFMRVLCR